MEQGSQSEFFKSIYRLGNKAELLPNGVIGSENVVYGHGDGIPLLMDLYDVAILPSKPRPAMVFIHGGGWGKGDKMTLRNQCIYLAARLGMVAATINYRLTDVARFPQPLHDCKCAMRWMRAHAEQLNIDPERIAVAGGSAGGHLAAMVALTPNTPEFEGTGGHEGFGSHANIAVLYNAVTDIAGRALTMGAKPSVTKLLGGEYGQIPDVYHKASPITYVKRNAPPVLLLHGAEDTTVPCQQAIDMRDAYRNAGEHAEVEIYPGAGHGWFNHAPHFMTTTQRMERFVADRFGLKIPSNRPQEVAAGQR